MTDRDWHVRPARDSDLDKLAAIEVEADTRYLQSGSPDMSSGGGIPIDVAKRYAAAGRLMVADAAEQLVGFIAWHQCEEPDYLGIAQVSVLPSFGRQGIGAALVNHVIDQATNDPSVHTVVLATQKEVPWNEPWYKRFGFQPVDPANHRPWMQAAMAAQEESNIPWTNRTWMTRPANGETS